MKIETLKKRMDKDSPMSSVTLRIPEDVIEDLKAIAQRLGYSGYQPLIRAYIGRGLREDLERLDDSTLSLLVDALKRHGVSESVLSTALAEARTPADPIGD
jgi:hypothetical protein